MCERMETKKIQCGWHILGKGWKKCKTCVISIKTKEMKCACCKSKLSTYVKYKNRNSKCLYVRNGFE